MWTPRALGLLGVACYALAIFFPWYRIWSLQGAFDPFFWVLAWLMFVFALIGTWVEAQSNLTPYVCLVVAGLVLLLTFSMPVSSVPWVLVKTLPAGPPDRTVGAWLAISGASLLCAGSIVGLWLARKRLAGG